MNFWLGFLFLNTVLFVPAFLLNAEATAFWPALFTSTPLSSTTSAADFPSLFFRLLIWRENLDIFRVNLEVTLMIAGWLFIHQLRRPLLKHTFAGLYVFMVIYYAYESAMLYLYRTDPVFFSDYYLARDGLGFLLENAQVSSGRLWIATALLLLIIALLGVGFRRTLHHTTITTLSRGTKLVLGSMASAALVAAVFYQSVLANPMMVTSSAIFKLAENIAASVELHRSLVRFNEIPIETAYDYNRFTLDETPDIYLILIESYGSVLYKRPDYNEQYAALAGRTQRTLSENGWHVATALSQSPTWGGGSWLAYTSTLFGLHIENHPQYLALLERYTLGDERYPHLPAYLQGQGYQYVWLSALSDQLSENQWDRYRRFYGFDQLIRYQDLNYTGPHYGWGPSPPDQYSLSYAHAQAIAPHDGPSLLFFITQNSHFPWAPIPPVLDDWRAFQQMEDAPEPEAVELIEHAALRDRYFDSIEYSFDMLVEFILHQGDEDAIYVILGDHQPPRVSRRSDDLDTPLHIISRNLAFMQSLEAYGFETGTIYLENQTPTLRHEGLYSLLVRHLIEYYGTDKRILPEYYPEGFSLYDHIQLPDQEEAEHSESYTTE